MNDRSHGRSGPGRRFGLVGIAVTALVVTVVAALVVTLLVRGDEPDAGATDGSATGSPSTATFDAQPASGAVVTGTGYSFNLPGSAWKDTTADALALDGGGEGIDTLVVLGASVEVAQSNVIVEAIPAGTATDPDDLEAIWKDKLGGTDGATVESIDDIVIDGQRAVGVRIPVQTNLDGLDFTQVAYLTLNDGLQYSIALTFPHTGDDVSEVDFESLLASWSWTG